MNIEALLQHIHPLVKKAIADFGKEGQKVFEEWTEEAEGLEEKDKLEKSLASFNRQIQQMDKLMMGTFQEQLTELAGESLDEVADEYKVQMTADDLRLVEEADLEQQVALETMAHKALNAVSAQLNLLNQRLNEGFKREDVVDKTNPFGPALFCETFGLSCAKIDVELDQKLELFRAFERSGLASLNTILLNANENLKKQGILPNAEIVHKSSREGANAGASVPTLEPVQQQAGEPQAMGQQAVGQQVEMASTEGGLNNASNVPVATNMHTSSGMFDISDPVVKQIFELIAKDGYAVLQNLLTQHNDGVDTRISSSGVGDQNFVGKKEVEDDELLDILNTLQRQALEDSPEIPVLEGEYQKASIAQTVGQALQTKSETEGAETTLSKTGSDVVSLVDMLFDFILSDDYLADGVKAVIAELQVPLTKVALMDPSFFSDNTHPARQLLNELSRSGMAAGRGTEALQDQTYKSITGTVRKVQENFDNETTVFTEALNEFTEINSKQSRRVEILEKRTMDTEKGRAKTEHAEATVNKLYTKLRSRVPPAKAVNEFLDTAWRDVLMMTCLKFGSHSKQWKADSELTTKLMRSILLAKKARLDGKQMKIPMDLLKLLKKALDRISYDTLETKRLLSLLAKTYQKIAATDAEAVRKELIEFGGETAVAVRAVEMPKRVVEGELRPQEAPGKVPEGEEDVEEKELSPEEQERIARKAERDKQLEEEIAKEKEKIASAPEEALENTIKNLDQEIPQDLVEGEAPEDEFAPGNTWFDMVTQLPIGAWLELHQEEGQSILRCKLVANIKSLQKLIFVNKAGAKVAERKVVELAQQMKEQKAKVINDNMIFDQALENVIINLREK